MNFMDFSNDIVIQAKKEDLIQAFRAVIQEVNSEPTKKWFTLSDVSEYTGYKKPTLYKYVQEKKIPYYKRSGKLMFLKTDIDSWINETKSKH